jgi:hypothetical protein
MRIPLRFSEGPVTKYRHYLPRGTSGLVKTEDQLPCPSRVVVQRETRSISRGFSPLAVSRETYKLEVCSFILTTPVFFTPNRPITFRVYERSVAGSEQKLREMLGDSLGCLQVALIVRHRPGMLCVVRNVHRPPEQELLAQIAFGT